jgi:hypothetical protein
MPAPASYSYSVAALVAAQTEILGRLDAENGNALVKVYSEADLLLAQSQMTDPAGTVNGTTGQLTLTFTGVSLEVIAGGIATWAEITDANGVAVITMPVSAGTVAVAGSLVLSTTNLIVGEPLTISSATVG